MIDITHIDRENLEKTKQTADLLSQDFKELIKIKDPGLLEKITNLYESSNKLKRQLEEISNQLSQDENM